MQSPFSSEELHGADFHNNGPENAVIPGDTPLHLISFAADVTSRHTIHIQGPMVIAHQGTCEVID